MPINEFCSPIYVTINLYIFYDFFSKVLISKVFSKCYSGKTVNNNFEGATIYNLNP